jgi:thiol:disulfide interchange protein
MILSLVAGRADSPSQDPCVIQAKEAYWDPQTGKGVLRLTLKVLPGHKFYAPKMPGDTLDYSPQIKVFCCKETTDPSLMDQPGSKTATSEEDPLSNPTNKSGNSMEHIVEAKDLLIHWPRGEKGRVPKEAHDSKANASAGEEIFHAYERPTEISLSFQIPHYGLEDKKDEASKNADQLFQSGTSTSLGLKVYVTGLCCSYKICLPIERSLKIFPTQKSLQAKDLRIFQVENSLTAEKNSADPDKKTTSFPWYELFCAFLGGIILNFMPCVLPVIGLKLLSFTKQYDGKTFQEACLFTALGIFFSFFVLALIALGLKYILSVQLGWGTQFQDPLFLALITVVMFLFAANLLGAFTLRTPNWSLRWSQSKRHRLSSFASGAFATVLATPCTAPFLGSALSLLLTQDGPMILVLFLCIALGFALPYLLSIFFPIQGMLPFFARYSGSIEKVLGIVLLGSGLYFLWLLSFHQPGKGFIISTLLIAGAFLSLSGSLWWKKICLLFKDSAFGQPGDGNKSMNTTQLKGSGPSKKPSSSTHVFRATVLFGGFILFNGWNAYNPPVNTSQSGHLSMTQGNIHWTPLTETNLTEVLNQGKIVFVNITASWCMVCLVNDRVFYNPSIQKLLAQKNVVALKGDWTRPNPELQNILNRYYRVGLPFNLIISHKYPKGIVLSEQLTAEEIQRAFKLLDA